MIVGLDHIGIAVNNIDDFIPLYEAVLGLKLRKTKEAIEHKVKVAFFGVGNANIELVEPLGKDSPVAKFLEKRGQGLHHISFKVDNLERVLEQLKRKGVALVDEKPRIGVEGAKIVFLHPKATGNVLIELCQS